MRVIGDLPVIHDLTPLVTCPCCGTDDPDDFFVLVDEPWQCLVCDSLFTVKTQILHTTTLVEP